MKHRKVYKGMTARKNKFKMAKKFEETEEAAESDKLESAEESDEDEELEFEA